MHRLRTGFTLVEMMVIAPIVILLIGGFIGLIVNLTGEVMSSRGANKLAYDLQDALNRIEEDVKLSTTFLATNNISVSTTLQGYGSANTANFTNIDKTSGGGSAPSLILNALVTDGNPLSTNTSIMYLKDQPNPCTTPAEYTKNKPMSYNIVYFVDNTNTLWRRVIMPQNYATASVRCGATEPWQIPTCNTTSFCKAKDEKLIEGVKQSDFSFQYYTSAGAATPSATARNISATDDARNAALFATPTVEITINAKQTIAGRDISRAATLRATRLDTNAASIIKEVPVTSAPAAPVASGAVTNGHVVTFTWPQVASATTYGIDYQVKANGAACDAATSGTWTTGSSTINNTTRSYAISAGTHTDRVCVRVRANNSFGWSTYGTASTIIPLWAPLLLKDAWTDHSTTYSSSAYTKTKAGLVLVKGLVKKSTAAVSGEVIATLPTDYAPVGGRLLFGTSTYDGTVTPNNATGRVDVNSNGDIILYNGVSNWFSLDTIRYSLSTNTRTTPATLQNSWVNFAAGYAPVSYVQDSAGRVNVQGLAKSGVITDLTPIVTLPAAMSPPQQLHFASRSSIWAHIGVLSSATPSVVAKGTGSNSYLSVNASYMTATPTGATWTALTPQNSWTFFGAPYTTFQYVKANDGVVHLKGLLKGGTTGINVVIAKLPTGAAVCPNRQVLYSVANNAAYARIDIAANGNILYQGTINGWLSLDNISFMAEKTCP